MRILFIVDKLPYPPDSGDRIRMYHLITRAAQKHEVWLAALIKGQEDADALAHLRRSTAGVITARLESASAVRHMPGLVDYALHGRPLELKFLHSPEFARKIHDLTSSMPFDAVQIEHSYMALYREAVADRYRNPQILEFHNIEYAQHDRIARLDGPPSARARIWLYSRMMQRWEPRYAKHFDRCVTMSTTDRDLLLAANPCLRIEVIPNGVDTQAYKVLPEEPARPSLLFVGTMSYEPCADAVLTFCRDVLPRIRQTIGPVDFWIVGKDPPAEVKALQGEDVHVTGRVADVVPYYRQCTACVVPLRAGGGTRLKVLEAMALGRPAISTAVGCEGLDVEHGKHLLVADGAEAFAQQTARLLTDQSLRQRLVGNARRLVEEHYDWSGISRRLLQVYAELQVEQRQERSWVTRDVEGAR